MNIHILLDLLLCNAYVALNYCVLMIFSLSLILFLLILYYYVTYCFDLIAYCNLALSMMNSTFNLTCADGGSVNVCVYVCTSEIKMNYSQTLTSYPGNRQSSLLLEDHRLFYSDYILAAHDLVLVGYPSSLHPYQTDHYFCRAFVLTVERILCIRFAN